MKTKIDKQVMMYIAAASAAVSVVFGIIGIVSVFIPFLVCFTGIFSLCAAYLVVPAGAGVWAVKKHNINKEMIADGLMMGAVAGVVSGVVYSIISTVFTVISSLLGVGIGSALSQNSLSDYGVDVAVTGGFTIVGALIGACVVIVGHIVVAAVAGLIMAAVTETKGGAKPEAKAEKVEVKAEK